MKYIPGKRGLPMILFMFGLGGMTGQQVLSQEVVPRNVILLIGDGMGLSQLSTAYYFLEEDRLPAFSRFACIGLSRTSSGSAVVTQSPAAATAMATGYKTYNDAVGVDMDTLPRPNIIELVSKQGWKTGVIATSSITDATPACFYAHQPRRHLHREIARDLLNSDVDFFAGGGSRYFMDRSGRREWEAPGMHINFKRLKKIKNPEEGDRFGFLLGPDRLPSMLEGRRNFLEKSTSVAIDFLSGGENPYFLMIESSQIDWAGHGNQVDYMLSEMMDFEHTVNSVMDHAEADGETLVILTADHETGGFTLGADGNKDFGADYTKINPTFASTTHSATLVPVLAYGPGAENFMGIYENTEIFHKLVSLIVAE